ncbi:MAG: TonB family protein [Elusimicrobia bacterium]|nr:TonB family protein [Elusimicrobiota bacterium]
MASVRLPVSMMTSLALHAGAFAAYFYASQVGPRATTHMIGNVDLMIEVHHAVPPPSAAPKQVTPPSTWNFLKMALPAVPKMAQLEVKAPEISRVKPLSLEPKLQERARKDAAPKLAKLDLGEKRVDMAKLEAKIEARRAAALSMPRLEDVGVHKVKNLDKALALEERRQEAVQQAKISGLNVQTHAHIAPAQAMKLLEEAEPQQRSRIAQKIADMLPTEKQRGELREEMRPAPDDIAKKMDKYIAQPPARRAAAGAAEEKKKGVEIEGPLKNRQVLAADIPPFPDWLKSLGTPEAAVRLNFCVEADGSVAGTTIRPEQSSGYGRLDRLTIDSLRNWKFAPVGSQQRQCGIITFRFELE